MEQRPNETDRRRFVKLALVSVSAVSVAGCLDGGNGDDGTPDGDAEPDTPETADFGYKTWVPVPESGYTSLGYADLGRLRGEAELERDGETATVAGDAGPSFADVDRLISTGGEDGFTALSGSFDADALVEEIADELVAAEEDEHEGFAVVRGNDPLDEETDDEAEVSARGTQYEPTVTPTQSGTGEREVVVSDGFVVSGSRGTATRVVDAALGETEREADANDSVGEIERLRRRPHAGLLRVLHR